MSRKLPLTDFITWLLKQYKEILDNTTRAHPLRIIDEEKDKEGNTIFTIQFVGKNVCPKFKANDIVQDDEMLQCFSQLDVKKIMKAITNRSSLKIVSNEEETEFTVVTKNLDRHTKQHVFSIKHLSSGKILTEQFSSRELAKDKNILKKFNKKDIYDIGVTSGSENTFKTFEEIEKIKKEDK